MSWPAEKAGPLAAITTARTLLVVVDFVQRGMQFGDQAFRQAVARRRAG